MRLLKQSVILFSVLCPLLYSLVSCQPETASSADPYAAVPKNAALILQTHDLQQALQEITHTKVYGEADSLPPLLHFKNQLLSLSALFAEDSLHHYLKNRTVLITAALSGAEKYNLLFISSGNRDLEKAIGKKMLRDYKVKQKTYSEAEVFHFFKEDGSKNYFVSAYRDVILFSTSSNLVEEGIRQINSGYNLKQDADFNKLYETSNEKDVANLFINLKEMPGLLKKWLPLTESGFVSHLGSWAELDVQVHNQELIMSGLSLLPGEEAFYLQSFDGVDAQKTTAQEIIPANAGLWVGTTFANAEQYHRNYRAYLERQGRLRKHDQLLAKLNFDAEEFLLQWVDSEMGFFAFAGKSGANNQVAYFSYRDAEDATQKLDQLADPDFIEGYRGIVIKKMQPENALPRLYGRLFEDFHFPYFIVHNGFVLFCENLPVMKGTINDLLDGKTLAQDEGFVEFNGKLPSKTHLKVLATSPGFLPILANALEGGDARIMETQAEGLNNFRWAALQMKVDDDAAYTNFYLVHASKKKERVGRQWSTQLQSQAANVPQFLRNHQNRKYDIAIQDKDHRLYLIDYNGKILWTKMLDGPIMGNITQVDAFKNNKLQMVVNTSGTLYLIDRLGRDVENFPVKLDAAATAPVGVFNYDQARNYRLVVPVGDELANYGIDGKKTAGWNFKKAKSAIITQPQHFTVTGKDVITVETEDGRLLQLDRKGEKRFETIEGLPKLHIPFYLKAGESLAKSEMLTIADDGKLYAFHPGGTADNLFLDEENPAGHFLFFDDKYIFSSDDKLFVKSDTKPWSAEMESDISSKPKAMIFRNDFYAGAFSARAEEIRLFNKNGELIEGFPVFAQGPFDMGSLKVNGSINIVTYSEDGTLICYVVN